MSETQDNGSRDDEDMNSMSNILKRVTVHNDNARIIAATGLLNAFNVAVQVQTGRRMWAPSDYRAFAIALSAMDSIGIVGSTQPESNQSGGNGLVAQIENDMAASVADTFGGVVQGKVRRD